MEQIRKDLYQFFERSLEFSSESIWFQIFLCVETDYSFDLIASNKFEFFIPFVFIFSVPPAFRN